jgi:hypothetical protein
MRARRLFCGALGRSARPPGAGHTRREQVAQVPGEEFPGGSVAPFAGDDGRTECGSAQRVREADGQVKQFGEATRFSYELAKLIGR